MEEHTVEEETVHESSSSMLPIAVAVLALFLGGGSLYYSMQLKQELDSVTAESGAADSMIESAEAQIATLEAKVSEFEAMTYDLEKTIGRLKAYGNVRDQKLNEYASAITANQDQISLFKESILATPEALKATPVVATSTRPAVTVDVSAESSEVSSNAVENSTTSGFYAIESGDTLGKIAAKYGISLQALMDANPNVDPRRLKIGQEIALP